MDAQVHGDGHGHGHSRARDAANDNGYQVRKVHIVYFLSRNGNIEHPHLIRIHHFSRNGVHLRDVKSWLSELRGKDMPDCFAWSYKRKYKDGYVWQDLLDDDLITPSCDNEYVLKGSEISSNTLNNDMTSYNLQKEEVFERKKSPSFEVNRKDPKYPSLEYEYPPDFSTNTSVEIEESSFGSNVTTEDTTKNRDEHKDEEVVQSQKDKKENNPFLNKNINDNNNSSKSKSKKPHNKSVAGCFKRPPSPSRFSGSRASHMFRNWITCGTANTNEKAVVVINKRKGGRTSMVSSVSEKSGKENNTGQICEEKNLRGSEKSFEGEHGSKKSKEGSNNFRTYGAAAAYKPVNGPNCSQCGRQFNPEKLHKHMKYCRGLKASTKSTNRRPKPKTSTTYSPSSPSLKTLYLSNS